MHPSGTRHTLLLCPAVCPSSFSPAYFGLLVYVAAPFFPPGSPRQGLCFASDLPAILHAFATPSSHPGILCQVLSWAWGCLLTGAWPWATPSRGWTVPMPQVCDGVTKGNRVFAGSLFAGLCTLWGPNPVLFGGSKKEATSSILGRSPSCGAGGPARRSPWVPGWAPSHAQARCRQFACAHVGPEFPGQGRCWLYLWQQRLGWDRQGGLA